MKRIISIKKVLSIAILSTGLFLTPFLIFNSDSHAKDNISPRNVNLKYNGVFSDSDVPAVLYNSRTLVPLRFIAESTGAEVDWNNDRIVTITSKDKDIKLKIDDEFVTINDISKKIDYGVPPKLIDGKTMVPLRFISDLLDANVEWYNDSSTASVIYPKKYHGNGDVPEDQQSAVDALVDGAFLNLNKVNVKFDSKPFKSQFPPVLYSEKTMVPLRDLANKVGVDVIWNQDDLSITLISDGKKIVLQIGSDKAIVNGVSKNIGSESKPVLFADSKESYYTMVPIRFITEELGYELEWNQGDTSVNIVENNKNNILSNVNVGSDDTFEFLELYLSSASNPIMDYTGGKTSELKLTIPKGKIDINGINSYSYSNNGLIKSVNATENSDSSIEVLVTLSNETTVNSRFYGNNMVLQFAKTVAPNPDSSSLTYTNYNMSFTDMLNLQMTKSKPTTDKNYTLAGYIQTDHISKSIDGISGEVVVSETNVKSGASLSSDNTGVLPAYSKVQILREADGFYEIFYTSGKGFRPAKKYEVEESMSFDPNVKPGSTDSFKFLNLSKPSGINATVFNKALKDKGILKDKGESFVTASQEHGVNDAYLIAHAILETGNGSSTLANGVLVTYVDGETVTPQIVYNMFGIGAKDSDALRLGAERAYQEGWFSPEKAIIGGAKFIGEKYINRQGNNQNTIYEMRWNPLSEYINHQYATDIDWANKQVNNIKKFYDMADEYNLHFDIPVYK